MKKLSQFFLVFLSLLLIISTLAACGSGSSKSGQVSKPGDGIDVFTFLDRYNKTMSQIGSGIESSFPSNPVLPVQNDDTLNCVLLPCGKALIRKDDFVIDSLEIKIFDSSKRDTNHFNRDAGMKALVALHAIEGKVWELESTDSLEDAVLDASLNDADKLFSENIYNRFYDSDINSKLLSGETVLLFSGHYNYSASMAKSEDVSGEEQYDIFVKIEPN